jgi:pimeloyl-ACP methyl ester carboxylesterase
MNKVSTRILTAILLMAVLLGACAAPPAQIEPSQTPQPAAQTEASADTPAPEQAAASFESAACPFTLPAGQIEGQTVDCGYLVVPENRADPESRSIRLAVAIFHLPGGAQHPDPIVYLAGGPGGSALEQIDLSFELFALAAKALQRDLVFFDQRGVGLSQPALDCPEAVSLGLELLDFELDGQPVTWEQVHSLLLEKYRTCAETLSAAADLSAYNSAASAADLDDLRNALGYEQWNLWGGSYGTRLALTVMRDFPEGVRSVVLDAAYPLEADLYMESPAVLSRALNQLFERCAADPGCSAAYPDLEKTFFETVAQLNENPASYQIIDPISRQVYPVKMDGNGLIGVTFQFLYLTDVIPMLPQIINDAHNGDFTMLAQIRSVLLRNINLSSTGMQFSVQCTEEVSFSSKEDFMETLVDYPELASFYSHALVGALTYDVCQFWPAGQAATQENQAVHSSIPTLVMTSEFDPIAYPAWGEQIAGSLENAYFFAFPAFGHGSSQMECPRSMMATFINDPTQEPDPGCMDEITLTFVVPSQLANIELESKQIESSSIEALMPAGWLEVYDYYLVSPDRKIELVVKKETGAALEGFLAQWGAGEPVTEFQSHGLNWQVYPIHVSGATGSAAGYLGISPLEEGFYMVLGIGPEALQEDIGEYLVTPIIQSVTPMD